MREFSARGHSWLVQFRPDPAGVGRPLTMRLAELRRKCGAFCGEVLEQVPLQANADGIVFDDPMLVGLRSGLSECGK